MDARHVPLPEYVEVAALAVEAFAVTQVYHLGIALLFCVTIIADNSRWASDVILGAALASASGAGWCSTA